MKRPRKSGFLYKGQEVTTDDGVVAIVDEHTDNDEVKLRHYEPNWPFPKWITKTRKQLTIVPLQYEEAPF
jgi:hypothetical protein